MITLPSITRQRVKTYTYIYESTSYRDAQGRPRNHKRRIGKVDPITGEDVFDEDYLREKGLIAPSEQNRHKPTVEALTKVARGNVACILDSIRSCGTLWFLQGIAQKIGLWDVLQQAFPSHWQEIFTLASYLVAGDKPVMYCEDWLAEQVWLDVGSMSSQRISDLLWRIDETQRFSFFRAWCQYIQEREYIALDTTSISCHSQQIADCEWGYNRGNESLPQVNLCMLYGASSRLPVYQTHFSGSLKDVTTLESTISEFGALTGDRSIVTVMDKGFFSTRNIDMLLDKGVSFVVAIPFSVALAKSQIAAVSDSIDRAAHMIRTSAAPIRGVHSVVPWGKKGRTLHVHTFYNPQAALDRRNELYEHVQMLKRSVFDEAGSSVSSKDRDHYITFCKPSTENPIFTAMIDDDKVEGALETAGWFVLISDSIANAQAAYDIYRLKDGVEKCFWKYKNSLGMDRLRVHSDRRMLNKSFVAFIALILSSHVHKTLKDKDLYRLYTFDRLFLTLATMKTASIGDQQFIRKPSKRLQDIFATFDIAFPVG